jgi:Arc/MetJ-type ribon-helix-helix transcriptional regulator
MSKRKLKFWNIPVTAYLDECLERAVQVNSHVSKSDFVRDAVREKLAKIGLLPEEADFKEVLHT